MRDFCLCSPPYDSGCLSLRLSCVTLSPRQSVLKRHALPEREAVDFLIEVTEIVGSDLGEIKPFYRNRVCDAT